MRHMGLFRLKNPTRGTTEGPCAVSMQQCRGSKHPCPVCSHFYTDPHPDPEDRISEQDRSRLQQDEVLGAALRTGPGRMGLGFSNLSTSGPYQRRRGLRSGQRALPVLGDVRGEGHEQHRLHVGDRTSECGYGNLSGLCRGVAVDTR